MNLRTWAIALLFALLAGFSLLNWAAFTTPTTLNLGLMDIQAPVGVVMLVFIALLSGLFLVFVLYQQASIIMEGRRTARELKSQRELADKAEASRFTELRAFLETELGALRTQQAASSERQERVMLDKLDEASRSLAAHIGEVEDKLDRFMTPPSA